MRGQWIRRSAAAGVLVLAASLAAAPESVPLQAAQQGGTRSVRDAARWSAAPRPRPVLVPPPALVRAAVPVPVPGIVRRALPVPVPTRPVPTPPIVLSGPTPPPAPVLATVRSAPVAPSAQQVAEQRGWAALGALNYPWRQLGYEVRFAPYAGSWLGLNEPAFKRITIFVQPAEPELVLRSTIAHELGHALDAVWGEEVRRQGYLVARGRDPWSPWYPCWGCEDFAYPAGDFAESFAMWLVGQGDFRGTFAPAPNAAELAALIPYFVLPSGQG